MKKHIWTLEFFEEELKILKRVLEYDIEENGVSEKKSKLLEKILFYL